MSTPKSKITYTPGHVEMVITCEYEANKFNNTAKRVWDIIADFSNVKIFFPTLIRNYLTYPDDTTNLVGTIRDMTFGGSSLSVAIEKLTKLDNEKRSLTYISLDGFKNYEGVITVEGENACTLTWTVNYDQDPVDKSTAEVFAGLFESAETEIGKVLNS